MSALPQAFHIESAWVPYPANLAPLLRPDHPARHWASVLRTIFSGAAMARYDAKQGTDCAALRKLLERNCTNPAIARYVVRLAPVIRCAHCGKSFLAEQARTRYCSQACLEAGKRHARNAVPR